MPVITIPTSLLRRKVKDPNKSTVVVSSHNIQVGREGRTGSVSVCPARKQHLADIVPRSKRRVLAKTARSHFHAQSTPHVTAVLVVVRNLKTRLLAQNLRRGSPQQSPFLCRILLKVRSGSRSQGCKPMRHAYCRGKAFQVKNMSLETI